MQNDLIHAAAKLFQTFEHWKSIQELANNLDKIKDEWFVAATDKIRQHFNEAMSPEWGLTPVGERTERNTCWFLKEYGCGSLSIRFWSCYQFVLRVDDKKRFDVEKIKQLLSEKEYDPISRAFGMPDKQFVDESISIQMPDYRFDVDGDGHYSDRDLAWFAAHEPFSDLFVEQAIAKVEKFTKNPQVTELLRKINQIAMDAAKAEKK